jgi:cytochrome b561/polyisoprenoid-binding protein YceI
MIKLNNSELRYGWIAMLLHWGMAIAIIAMLAVGIYMEDLPFGPQKLALIGWHKATGMLLLALAVARLLWRVVSVVPSHPSSMAPLQRKAADAAHWALYGLMIAIPLSGYLLSTAAGFPVALYNWGITLPLLFAPSKEAQELFGEAHELMAWGLLVLIHLHVLAALYHHAMLKDGVLRRMLPLKMLLVTWALFPLTSIAGESRKLPHWEVQEEHSELAFVATQNNAPVLGSFRNVNYDIAFDPEHLDQSEITVVVDINSLEALNPEVMSTLKLADWFSSEVFPEARFESTEITKLGGNLFQAEGKLTIRDRTVPVTLPFVLEKYTATDAFVSGEVPLSRNAFGVGQGAWQTTEVVADAVTVRFHLQAKRKR